MSKPLSTDAKVGLFVGAIGIPFGLAVGLAVLLALGAYFAFVNGYVLSKLWQWHAVPLGLPSVSWTACAALVLMVRTISPKDVTLKTNDDEDKSAKVGKAIGLLIAPWFMLAIGWWLT